MSQCVVLRYQIPNTLVHQGCPTSVLNTISYFTLGHRYYSVVHRFTLGHPGTSYIFVRNNQKFNKVNKKVDRSICLKMATPRSNLTTAEICLTAPIALMMEKIKSFYVEKYALSLERMALSQSADLLKVSGICKFSKRQKIYLRTVTETINGQ